MMRNNYKKKKPFPFHTLKNFIESISNLLDISLIFYEREIYKTQENPKKKKKNKKKRIMNHHL